MLKQVTVGFLATIWCAMAASAGDLTPPPGPVSPTMKPLTEVEPRIVVNNLPAGVDAVHVIDQPGSYYLSANITGAAGLHGIQIDASDVTLDLNGFNIQGVPGSDHGIVIGPFRGVTINGGTVTGFGMRGIDAATSRACIFDSIISRNNGDKGIAAGFDTVLRHCVASGNSGDGIFTNTGGLVTACVSSLNAGDGFDLSLGTAAIDCVADSNGENGFFIIQNVNVNRCTARNNGIHGLASGAGTTVRDSQFRGNDDHGIRVTDGCSVINNQCDENVGPGIRVDDDCTVRGNACDGNGAFPGAAPGILVEGARNHIDGNTVIGNTIGIHITESASVVTRNTAIGNTTNYDIHVGNDTAPVSSAATATSPLANIEQ